MALVEWLKWTSVTAAFALWQWIVIYTFLEPWWRSRIGRSLVSNAALASVTPVLFILALWFHLNRLNSVTLAWIEVGVFIGITLLLSWRSFIWVRASRAERDQGA